MRSFGMGDEFHLGTVKKNVHSFNRYINHPLWSFSSTQNILPCRILIFMIGLKWFAQIKTKTIVKNFNLRLIWILRIIMLITIYKGYGFLEKYPIMKKEKEKIKLMKSFNAWFYQIRAIWMNFCQHMVDYCIDICHPRI